MDEIRLWDLSVLNIEKKFSENLYFNSVVDTFAQRRIYLNSKCSRPTRPIQAYHVCTINAYINNCSKYVIINV